VDSGEQNIATTTRDAALSRVLAYPEPGRAGPMPIRTSSTVLGGVLASIPLIKLLPEAAIPALLVTFRLLAVEAESCI
jgi:hypothetical protein